jgi:hypothetical protein
MYRWIRTWGQLAERPAEEILATLAQAWAEDAPVDAVYRESDGTWKTLADLDEAAIRGLTSASTDYAKS